MRLYRFDAAVGRSISDHGSRFTLVPLTDPDAETRAACVHLGPGGLVGRHEAATRQLWCVVAGEGWVSGDDGTRVPIGPFQAALWERGEQHEAGTDTGLVAVVLEGDDGFTVWAAPGGV